MNVTDKKKQKTNKYTKKRFHKNCSKINHY